MTFIDALSTFTFPVHNLVTLWMRNLYLYLYVQYGVSNFTKGSDLLTWVSSAVLFYSGLFLHHTERLLSESFSTRTTRPRVWYLTGRETPTGSCPTFEEELIAVEVHGRCVCCPDEVWSVFDLLQVQHPLSPVCQLLFLMRDLPSSLWCVSMYPMHHRC